MPAGVNVIPTSLPQSATSAAPAAPQMPSYQGELMAALLKGSSKPDYSNVRTPLGGLAEALKEGVQGWQTRKKVQAEDQKKWDQASMLASMLKGEPIAGNPQDDRVASAIYNGVDPEFLISNRKIASNMGIDLGDPEFEATDNIREWQFAQENPEFEDYQERLRRAGSPQNVVNVGGTEYQLPKEPPNYIYAKDENGQIVMEPDENGYMRPVLVPIANSEADIERRTTAAAAESAENATEQQANILFDEADRALGIIAQNPRGTTGWGGAFFSWLPESQANAVMEKLTTIKSIIGFDKLQAMRDASPTGGALGQVSEFENRLLQAVWGSLAQTQKADDLAYNLRRLKKTYAAITGIDPSMLGVSEKIAGIGKMVDAGTLSEAEGEAAVNRLLSDVPEQRRWELPDGAVITEIP